MVGIPRALTARHVGVAPSIVNNNPENKGAEPAIVSYSRRLVLKTEPVVVVPADLATARGEPGPITTGGDHGFPLSRGQPDGGTSFGQKAARAPLMLRSIAARSEYGCFHNSAALRCVSKHEGALVAVLIFETRACSFDFAEGLSTRAPQDEGGSARAALRLVTEPLPWS